MLVKGGLRARSTEGDKGRDKMSAHVSVDRVIVACSKELLHHLWH